MTCAHQSPLVHSYSNKHNINLMISDNNTNLNLSYHPPNPCLLLLPRSLILSPPPPPPTPTFPSPSPYPYASIYIQLPHTDTDFFRFYRKAWANKKVSNCDLNWDSVGTFLRVAGREFQRDGAMKLKERCPNDLRFRFGILSSFSPVRILTWFETCRITKINMNMTTIPGMYICNISKIARIAARAIKNSLKTEKNLIWIIITLSSYLFLFPLFPDKHTIYPKSTTRMLMEIEFHTIVVHNAISFLENC